MTSLDRASNAETLNKSDGTSHTARLTQTRRSALWAAYGDALGWISELTDAAGLKMRTGGMPLHLLIEWKRRVGGRGGVTVSLPKGCYSDDSQLRLATSRAIRADGFDVEAFAKVELPVWLGYALGGGKSTSAAALNLAKPRAPWFANEFRGWTKSGGNGAAMRIQPHVWTTHSPQHVESFILDVVRNAICTHSHPTGLIGAVLHALTLAHTAAKGCPPSPDEFLASTKVAAQLLDIVANDPEISYWRTAFERESGAFDQAWMLAIAESREVILAADKSAVKSSAADRYTDVVERLALKKPQCRGSGLLTSVAALSLAWSERSPEEALRIAANAIGTDTDTIATMAGAILGMAADHEPSAEVLDAELFRSEADRLTDLAFGREAPFHHYPDLLQWNAPKTRADTLNRAPDGKLCVAGLGYAKPIGDSMVSATKGFAWRWIRLDSGQTLLIKHRKNLEYSENEPSMSTSSDVNSGKEGVGGRVGDLFAPINALPLAEKRKQVQQKNLDMQSALQYLKEHMDDDRRVGHALRKIAQKGTTAEYLEFTAAFWRHQNSPQKHERDKKI